MKAGFIMKKIFIFTPIFLICVIAICAVTPTVAMSEDISNNVLRLHIIANSDSAEDQALKLKVRDKVVSLSEALYADCSSLDEAIAVTSENLDIIRDTAQKTLAFITEEYFSTRYYDNFTLPAGMYNSIKIEVGEAKGKNWWCVMFPTVCISGCTDDFDETLTEEEKEMLTSGKYIVRFKAVEIYEKIKATCAN